MSEKKIVSRRISPPEQLLFRWREVTVEIVRHILNKRTQPRFHVIGSIAELVNLVNDRAGHILRLSIKLPTFPKSLLRPRNGSLIR